MKKYLNYAAVPIDYQTVSANSKDAVYSYACLVYKTTADSWTLHLYDPSSATAQRISVSTGVRRSDKWLISDPIDLSMYGNRHIMRYNNGRHGLFAFDTEDKNAVFYVKELAFFLTEEDAKKWKYDENGVPHPTVCHTSIMLTDEHELERNAILYKNVDPYKTGTLDFSASERAVKVTYTPEEYIIGRYVVGHFRLAPQFVKSRSNMLYLTPRHEHTCYEMTAVLSGLTEITVRGKIFNVEAGQLVFIPKNYFHIHRSLSDTPLRMVTVHFDIPSIEFGLSKVITMDSRQTELLKLICGDMEESCACLTDSVAVPMSATAEKLFEVFFEYVMNSGYTPEPPQSKDGAIFRTAVNFMKSNLENKLSVQEIAAECAVCKTKLTGIFENQVGMGCMKYFAALKMERARQLLIAGKSCYEVSKELGFPSQAYLSKRFKLHFGTVPSSVTSSHRAK